MAKGNHATMCISNLGGITKQTNIHAMQEGENVILFSKKKCKYLL